MGSAAPRLPFLDALRGYAILAVIMVHVGQTARLPWPVAADYTEHGRYGVQLFFVVSAVSIAMTWHARGDGFRRFLVRRLFRLLPALWLAAIGYALLGAPNWWHAALTLTLLDSLHPAAINSVVPGTWSLSTELMFYLAVPLLAACIRSLRVAAIWIICAELISHLAVPWSIAFWDAVYPAGIGTLNTGWMGGTIIWNAKWFLLGWTAYLVMRELTLPPRASQVLLSIALACLVLSPLSPSSTLHDFALMFGMPAIVCAMSGGAGSWLDNAPMRWLGTVSYGMYLWHNAIYMAIDEHFGHPSFLPLFAASVVATALAASFTYVLIERPGIRLGAALLRGRVVRPAPQLDHGLAITAGAPAASPRPVARAESFLPTD